MLTALSLSSLLQGCGGGDEVATQTGSVTIAHMAELRVPSAGGTASAPLPEGTDSLHVSFLNDQGEVVLGPVELPSHEPATVNNVPLTATSTSVHYLRNGGYALAAGTAAIAWTGQTGLAYSAPTPAPASHTKWSALVDEQGRSQLQVAISSVNNGQAKPFLLKGVGYSPAPIGFSNKDGPGFGDLFWDTPGNFLDFDKVWKRDIENIRKNGFNAIRTYSLIAHFIHNDGRYPTPEEIHNPSNYLIRQHKKFLDACWNNGHNPIYVIVGVPMPDAIYVKPAYDAPGNASAIRFWDDNFTATLTQMKDHPAVIGFTMFNEIGGPPDFSDDPVRATHYWRQIQKYADRGKAIAPDKLIGWAFNDDVNFASRTVEYRRQYAKSVDFYGVNAFQAQQLRTTLDPWVKATQQDTARPIILTEFGLPATGHSDLSVFKPYVEPILSQAKAMLAAEEQVSPLDIYAPPNVENQTWVTQLNSDSIYADSTTLANTAKAVRALLPQAFSHPVVSGVVYFEWSDEWWKQDSQVQFFVATKKDKPVYLVKRRNDRQEGGNSSPGFPNGFWDEEGFGLHSIALNGRSAQQVYTDRLDGQGGNVQVDKLTPRTPILNAVVESYRDAEQTRRNALGL